MTADEVMDRINSLNNGSVRCWYDNVCANRTVLTSEVVPARFTRVELPDFPIMSMSHVNLLIDRTIEWLDDHVAHDDWCFLYGDLLFTHASDALMYKLSITDLECS